MRKCTCKICNKLNKLNKIEVAAENRPQTHEMCWGHKDEPYQTEEQALMTTSEKANYLDPAWYERRRRQEIPYLSNE